MSPVLKNFSVKDCKIANFWIVNDNLQLLAVEAFRKIYEIDTSEDKEKSSRFMWAIALIWDYESKYYRVEEADRIDLVEKDFLGDEGFFKREMNNIQDVITAYENLQKDSIHRMLRLQQKKLDERTSFMNTTPYSLDTAKILDAMTKETKNILATIKTLEEEIQKKEGESQIKGDHKPSMLETGDLEE